MNEFTISFDHGTPARVDSARAAKLLGFQEHDIPALVRAKLLKPLGSPLANNAPRYFASCELVRLANDVAFLNQATRVIGQYWKRKNSRRTKSQLTAAA
jgi:hypothetical protein